jgi:4-hydroxybenzoate polyprenyltransferase
MRPWQKNMVVKRMMRIKRMVNSLLLMFLVMLSARSVLPGLAYWFVLGDTKLPRERI